MPVYNREKVVADAIKTVLDQTLEDFELIIVDDCSTDNSVHVISGFEDKRIKLFRLDKNSGPAVARNYGIKRSTGKYISFLDSDDSFEPQFLEESFKVLQNTPEHVGFMWTGIRLTFFNGDPGNEIIWEPERKETPYLTFLNDLKVGTGCGITLKKEVFETCGLFNEKLPAAEDTEFFLRISKKYDYASTPRVLINIKKNDDDRISKNFSKIAEAYNIFIGSHLEAIEKNMHIRYKYYYKMMWLNYHLHEKIQARQYFKRICKDSPFAFKSYIVFALYELLPLEKAKKYHMQLAG